LAQSYASDVHGVPVREVMAMRDGRHKALGDIAHRPFQFLYARGGGGQGGSLCGERVSGGEMQRIGAWISAKLIVKPLPKFRLYGSGG